MQKDMHYFGTYSMARASGLAPKICQTIATASEFVDDNGSKETIEFPDGGRLDFIPTAHHTLDIKNIDHHDQRLIWVPFHFIPGNEGNSIEERLLCQKNSNIAREMVHHNLSQITKSFGLYLIGITAHVYADTFSHYGFSGTSSPWNKINSSTIELVNVEQEIQSYVDKKADRFREKYGEEMENFPGIRDPSKWNHAISSAIAELKEHIFSNAAEILSGALGHGAVLTYPDRPYLQWKFDYEYPERRSSGLRDNPATFLDACKNLHGIFQQICEQCQNLRTDEGRNFEDIKNVISQILSIQAPCKDREDAWKSAAKAGDLFVKSEPIPPYLGLQWTDGLENLRKSKNSNTALLEPIFLFFQAAAVHRTYVLRDLLPEHGLVVD